MAWTNNYFINIILDEAMDRLVKNEDYKKKLDTGGKLFDFIPGEYVQCSYRKGLFKVYGVNKDKLLVLEVNNKTVKGSHKELLELSPKFLKKVPLDSQWIKVLYDSK